MLWLLKKPTYLFIMIDGDEEKANKKSRTQHCLPDRFSPLPKHPYSFHWWERSVFQASSLSPKAKKQYEAKCLLSSYLRQIQFKMQPAHQRQISLVAFYFSFGLPTSFISPNFCW